MAWVPFAAMAGSKLFDTLFPPKGQKPTKLPTMSPQQQQMLNQLLMGLMGGGGGGGPLGSHIGMLQNLMDPSSEATNKFAQPYIDQFNQQTVPGLAERFAGAGGGMGGGLSSSGFGQSLSAAGGNLQNTLAALKGQLGMQAGGQLQSLMGMGLGANPFAYMYQPQGTGMFPGMMQGWAQAGFPGPWNSGGNSFQ